MFVDGVDLGDMLEACLLDSVFVYAISISKFKGEELSILRFKVGATGGVTLICCGMDSVMGVLCRSEIALGGIDPNI